MSDKIVLKDRFVSTISSEELEKIKKDSKEVSDFSKHGISVSEEDRCRVRKAHEQNKDKYKNKIADAGRDL